MSDNPKNESLLHSSLTETLLEELVKEKRTRRRWNNFFKILFFIWLFLFLTGIYISKSARPDANTPHTALINIQGKIMEGSHANSDDLATSLREAFEAPHAKGIILRINSPGGTPVTADYIFNEIRRLRKQYPEKKVYAVCMDVCASGAYYIAAAADEIYANPSSFVGSIATIYNGFGFVSALEKLGIERRMIASAEQKGFLDPFSPIEHYDIEILKNMLEDVHEQFKHAVQLGRGDRLSQNPELFSGLYWTGTKAKQLGLIDGFGTAGSVARDIIKEENIIDYTYNPSYLDSLSKKLMNSIKPPMVDLQTLNPIVDLIAKTT